MLDAFLGAAEEPLAGLLVVSILLCWPLYSQGFTFILIQILAELMMQCSQSISRFEMLNKNIKVNLSL